MNQTYQNQGQPTGSPMRESPLGGRVSELGSTVDTLHKEIEELYQQLKPLTVDRPEDAPKAVVMPKAICSTVLDNLAQITDNVMRASRRITLLRSQLDI